MSVSTVAGIVLVFATILYLPIALFSRDRRVVLAAFGVAVLFGFVVLAGNYFWPVLLLPLASLGLLARSRSPQSPPRPNLLDNQPEVRPVTEVGTALVVGLVLIAGWFLFFLPDLHDVVPILPADSPADTFSWSRVARDFSVNGMSALFALPWLLLLIFGLTTRSTPGRDLSRKAGSRR